MTNPFHSLWQSLVADAPGGEGALSSRQIEQLETYLELLIRANETMNLTRIVSPDHARMLHIADALTLPGFMPRVKHGVTRVLADLGSGGGVPGIPLAIALPNTRVFLVEATGKKAQFLKDTARSLNLANVIVHPLRAEEVGAYGAPPRHPGPLRDKCDIVTARAVGALVWLVEWAVPMLRTGGSVLAMKGPKLAEELPEARLAIRLLHASEPEVLAAPSLAVADRPELVPPTGHVVCRFLKQSQTGPKFPRAATDAKGKPIA